LQLFVFACFCGSWYLGSRVVLLGKAAIDDWASTFADLLPQQRQQA
jgi:hypothetical protein